MIHRDLKPANIKITPDGKVKILDFGLAKITSEELKTSQTDLCSLTGQFMGTLAYMSPEQLSGKEIDQHTDIWSLGVVICEMLIGKLPFKGDYEQVVIYSIYPGS